jgi:hypothetical protein
VLGGNLVANCNKLAYFGVSFPDRPNHFNVDFTDPCMGLFNSRSRVARSREFRLPCLVHFLYFPGEVKKEPSGLEKILSWLSLWFDALTFPT